MSETAQHFCRGQLRRRLLVTVSFGALLACVALARQADATETDHPTIWIEVGGSFDQISAGETDWSPPNLTPPLANPPPLPFGKSPVLGFGADLKLSFAPQDSDWIYSGSVRYGRAQFGPKVSHDQTYNVHGSKTEYGVGAKYFLTNYNFADAAQRSHSSYAIIDFTAGKDVGLGVFRGGTSVISAGIRVAQLNESAQGQLTAFLYAPRQNSPGEVAHKAELFANRSFVGIGPSVSWDASAPMLGSSSGGIFVDWGANAAMLFGRQKAHLSLRTKDTRYYSGTNYMSGIPTVLSQSTQIPARNKMVMVPNVGGFAGLSWRLPNAKISVGYRADLFFDAIDGGLLTSQKETRGFYGPFASISVGIGG
jgi:hypothetical protein